MYNSRRNWLFMDQAFRRDFMSWYECLARAVVLVFGDKTFKVWRISNSKCLESVSAHEDAVNSVVTSSEGMVFTGSADGTVKVWRREMQGKTCKHFFVQTLLKQECTVTALAVDLSRSLIYCRSSDGMVNFWERENLAHGGVLRDHKLAVLCLAARARLVFSGSVDKTICVRHREGTIHSCQSMLTGHSGPVKCLAVEDDKEAKDYLRKFIVQGRSSKSTKVGDIMTEEVTRLDQPFTKEEIDEVRNKLARFITETYDLDF